MHKIPVIETITRAYGFTYANIAAIIKIAGLPILIGSAISYAAERSNLAAMIETVKASRSGELPPPDVSPAMLAMDFVASVFYAYAVVGLHRLALFGSTQRVFALGRVERRFVGLSLVVAVVISIPGVTMVLLNSAAQSKTAGSVALTLVSSLTFMALAVISLRILPAYPNIVASGKIEIGYAWRLTQGNWWRLLWIYVIAFLPITVIAIATSPLMFYQPQGSALPLLEILNDAQRNLLVATALGYILEVVFAGLGVALLCNAYKTLIGLKQSEFLQGEPPA